ncbi:hypothetical protein SCA03_06140 [Streptomyces cacaoi]|uniref:Uncharacterized protein n=1 Tax=Streptomyces cacaoi TaxID=1898 RepID=A0A4Y3QTU6_STRCI|nr:hypothetical protein SCA03_06140 [Streptomyces cacaoi]
MRAECGTVSSISARARSVLSAISSPPAYRPSWVGHIPHDAVPAAKPGTRPDSGGERENGAAGRRERSRGPDTRGRPRDSGPPAGHGFVRRYRGDPPRRPDIGCSPGTGVGSREHPKLC